MNDLKLSCGPFKMGRWHCYTLMLFHQAPWMGLIMVLLAVGVIVAGFIVSPWSGLASIGFAAFIIVMGMSFVISVYGFSSVTGCNIPPHTVEIEPDKVLVRFEDEKVKEISKADIEPYRIYPGGVLVPVKGAHAGWLWIPAKIFESGDALQLFLKNLYIRET